MANAPITSATFMDSLTRAIRAEMDGLIDQEAEAAADRVRHRAREMAPRMAMALMSNFDVTMGNQEIVIRVRTEEPK